MCCGDQLNPPPNTDAPATLALNLSRWRCDAETDQRSTAHNILKLLNKPRPLTRHRSPMFVIVHFVFINQYVSLHRRSGDPLEAATFVATALRRTEQNEVEQMTGGHDELTALCR